MIMSTPSHTEIFKVPVCGKQYLCVVSSTCMWLLLSTINLTFTWLAHVSPMQGFTASLQREQVEAMGH